MAVVSHHGLRAALYDQPVVEPDASAQILQKLNPTSGSVYWMTNANPVRREVYLFQYGQPEVHVYRPQLVRETVETHSQPGDNPGYYKGTRFVGMKLQMPLRLPDPATIDGGVTLRLGTQYVETLGVSRHAVELNGQTIGHMTGGYFVEERETFDFFINRCDFEAIIASQNPTELTITVDNAPGRGMADDFVLRSVGVVYKPVR
ncbi:MAG: hypothetical protein R3C49_11215 [Planctomycetaceae bacterium]